MGIIKHKTQTPEQLQKIHLNLLHFIISAAFNYLFTNIFFTALSFHITIIIIIGNKPACFVRFVLKTCPLSLPIQSPRFLPLGKPTQSLGSALHPRAMRNTILASLFGLCLLQPKESYNLTHYSPHCLWFLILIILKKGLMREQVQ